MSIAERLRRLEAVVVPVRREPQTLCEYFDCVEAGLSVEGPVAEFMARLAKKYGVSGDAASDGAAESAGEGEGR